MGGTRRRHSAEFKIEAVRMVTEQGLSVTQVARDLGIERSLLTKWKRELTSDPEHAFPGKGRLKPMEEELRRLRKELEVVRQERDILKKATAFFAKNSR
jgi:transposase